MEKKREEILKYFHNTYDLFEKMFDILKDDGVFYKKSEPTRHPMIFYFGHTATFFVNKLINMNIIDKRINPDFESIFAIGVDEMEWDDLDEARYNWPKVEEVRTYRNKVRELVDALIKNMQFSLPVSWDSDMWIILMGIEHERIHIETSSVLHRQMPLELVKEVDRFNICRDCQDVVQNSLVSIPKTSVRLGKKRDDKYYGWDNEYGIYKEDVAEFKASEYLVSNAEFMEFVKAGGYENKNYWCEEGMEFLKRSGKKHPPFWIKDKDDFRLRTLAKEIDIPLSWPVEVNNLEAMAFCRYKSEKDGLSYTLPSEAEYEALCIYAGVDDMQSELNANHNFSISSSVPVSINEFKGGICDVVGNVWQHSRTPIRPFEGFCVHEAYDDFTTPTYDEKHALILGSSWASSGNLIMKHSRYAFRRHFYQHAGFRYVVSSSEGNQNMDSEVMDDIKQNYDIQFGSEFSKKCASIALRYSDKKTKALDLSCGCGRVAFELADEFESVEGIEFSARFIQKALKIKEDRYKDIDNVEFWQGDAKNLKANFNSYDLVVLSNMKEKAVDIDAFLSYGYKRMNEKAIFALVDFNKKESEALCEHFDFIVAEDVESYRLSVWRKK